MPGVTKGEEWKSRRSRHSDFGSLPRDMSPQRRNDNKSLNGSQYSNGHSDPAGDEAHPTYLLEHLATFSVGAQYGISSAKDGLRRLLQMEKSSGIWTQRMHMRLERRSVVIIDSENGDVVERFPMSLISEPTSYTSTDPRELYNNVVVFVVKDDPQNKSHSPPEMHIFQCARVSAQEVVNEMKMFIAGKWKPNPKENGRHLPPPPSNPPPEPPVNGVSVREQVNLFNAVAAAAASPPKGGDMQHAAENGVLQRVSPSGFHPKADLRLERDDSNDETSSTSSDKYERDVAILNHCFDDIERFIARLQHAAAAFKELERRQKSRKNKKKDLGDGMLSIRAKPPSEKEFIDILQKFKLSFNLLAKLKSHIHDPNAPELVHFLFTPLALIVDAARDSDYSATLPARVVPPLLTPPALELLRNCCTSKESDLWLSLGDSWTTPREHWEGYEGSYHPVFSDGWAPENPFPEERPKAPSHLSSSYTGRPKRADDGFEGPFQPTPRHVRTARAEGDFYYEERPASPPEAPPHSSFEGRYYDSAAAGDLPRRHQNGAATPEQESELSGDSEPQFERQQRLFVEELVSRGARAVQVLYPRTANNDKELTVLRGEYLEVIDDSRKWWKAKNYRGQVAHVPHTIVGGIGAEGEGFHNPTYAPSRSLGSRPENFYSHDESSPPKTSSESGLKDEGASSPRGSAPIPIHPAPADWVRRERQGKKGEFRYF